MCPFTENKLYDYDKRTSETDVIISLHSLAFFIQSYGFTAHDKEWTSR